MSHPLGVLSCVGCSDGRANTFWPANEPVALAPMIGIPVAAKRGGREPRP
jgi:hypothetical protein